MLGALGAIFGVVVTAFTAFSLSNAEMMIMFIPTQIKANSNCLLLIGFLFI